MTDDVRKLLGGFATGTLSEGERQALFQAALHDDQLFAALADEQILKDLLEDSAVRAQLLRATEEPKFGVSGVFREWFEQPKSKALVATGVILLAAIGVNEARKGSRPMEVAEVRRPPAITAPAPERRSAEPKLAAKLERPAVRPKREASPSQPEAALLRDEKEQTKKEEAHQAASAPPPPTTPTAPSPAPVTTAARRAVGEAPAPADTSVGPLPFRDQAQVQAQSAIIEQQAATIQAPLRYEILRRETDGEFRPVAPNHEFVAGDVVRLLVTSNRTGAVALSMANRQTLSAPLAANQPTSIPAVEGIPIAPETDKLVLVFVPQEAAGEVARIAKQASAGSGRIEIPIRQKRP
jgi:hypothetical protein